jgi:hypothetical protein
MSDYLRLPSARGCRRRVRLKLKRSAGVASFAIRAGRKPTRAVNPVKAVRVRLRKGRRTKVRATVALTTGTRLSGARKYRGCR